MALTAYYFYWYSPNSGDYYYGTVYDDGTYGYYTGEYVYGPYSSTESGSGDGYYYIYTSVDAAGSGYVTGEVDTSGNRASPVGLPLGEAERAWSDGLSSRFRRFEASDPLFSWSGRQTPPVEPAPSLHVVGHVGERDGGLGPGDPDGADE